MKNTKISTDKYKTWLFDCDGVILDSNTIKSEAFYQIAIPFGADKADRLVDLNKREGGVSRWSKISSFVHLILGKVDNELEEYLLRQFGDICVEKLINCFLTHGAIDFLKSIEDKDIFIVSGGSQDEIRKVFDKRNLSEYFTEIYGSPESKKSIVNMLKEEACIDFPCVFVGDSKSDYEAAMSIGSDFIFMYRYTEFFGWHEYFIDKDVYIIRDLSCI